jgi:hypothetical protein
MLHRFSESIELKIDSRIRLPPRDNRHVLLILDLRDSAWRRVLFGMQFLLIRASVEILRVISHDHIPRYWLTAILRGMQYGDVADHIPSILLTDDL